MASKPISVSISILIAAVASASMARPADASPDIACIDNCTDNPPDPNVPPSPPPPPPTQSKVVYLQGRGEQSWSNGAVLVTSSDTWGNAMAPYNGNARLYDAAVVATVHSLIRTNCSGDNECVVVCYSAGCYRLLYALANMPASDYANLLWIEATGSAAGGTEVSHYTTKWYKVLLAKLTGHSAAIDNDLHVDLARGTYGYIQNAAPVPMYHVAGTKDACVKFRIALFFKFKLCGNHFFPGHYGDGAVPIHSACGFSSPSAYPSCCAIGSVYTNRRHESCSVDHNHFGMIGPAITYGAARLARTATWGPCASAETDDTAGLPDGSTDATYDDMDAATGGSADAIPMCLGATPAPGEDDSGDTCGAAGCSYFSPGVGGSNNDLPQPY
jgi:hypothetical protein